MSVVNSICVGAGHGATGKGATGATGYINESDEARWIRNLVVFFNALGNKKKVVDCTVDVGTQSGVLSKAVKIANNSGCDVNIQIHFNASKKSKKDGKTKGVEALVHTYGFNKSTEVAQHLTEQISKEMGITNRGVKERKNLYFLRKTKKPAVILEVCFCDDEDDYIKYKKKDGAMVTAKAILDLMV
jgi:N-acetylmuramoyl-L-alanine amidase